jgi:DNA primase
MRRDLRSLLAAVDLEALADGLLGGHRGHGRGARWPSPVPGHPQTGRTPPMSIFTDRTGVQRWTCWATGRAGTAIDLVAIALDLDVAAAIDWLADRHGTLTPPPRRPLTPPSAPGPSADLLDYVAACRRLLWSEQGRGARRWLREERGLSTGVLEANRVGFDPGPGVLRRARGLPFRGRGVVLPTLDAGGDVVYTQVRYFDVDRAGRKYDNPSAAHGAKPRLAWTKRPPGVDVDGPVLICEGVIDALTVGAAGVRAVALIAAGDAGAAAAAVAGIDGPVVIAVDNDPAGHGACALLSDQLAAAGRRDVRRLVVPGDLNELALRAGDRFPAILRAALRGTRRPNRPHAGRGR